MAKNSKVNTTGDKDKALQLPIQTEIDSKDSAENEEIALPLPPHTVEQLYTAVVKKPKGSAVKDEEDTLPIPPYTIDTAVKKDSGDKTENEDVAPPIPPHTVEELYTAVQKKLTGSAEVEEEAPPIPPYRWFPQPGSKGRLPQGILLWQRIFFF